MIECSKVNVKLSDTQLKKLKNAFKDKTWTTLRITFKMFNGNDFPHELLPTTRQKTKLRKVFNNNMSTDLKLCRAPISKIIQFGGFLGPLLRISFHCSLINTANFKLFNKIYVGSNIW